MRPPVGSYELVTPPATEPVTVAEAKAHARIEHDADDALLGTYITGARELVERLTGRALITQTWKLVLDAWPGDRNDEWWDGVREAPITAFESSHIDIRKAPFLAVTSVVTLDESDTPTTYAASNYYTTKINRGSFGRLVKKQGAVWPTIVDRSHGAIVITFTAGYGPLASDVPMGLRQAVKDIVAHWYENREAVGASGMGNVPGKTAQLIQQFRVIG